MKAITLVLSASLLANAVLGVWWLSRPDSIPAKPAPNAGAVSKRPTKSPVVREDPAVLRDRLRASRFDEATVAAAVRAYIQAPGQAQTRDAYRAANNGQWWQGPASQAPSRSPQSKTAENAEIARTLGATARLNPQDIEPYLFLPPDRAAEVALNTREYNEAVADDPPNPDGSYSARRQRLLAERNQRFRDLLTPHEGDELNLRWTNLGEWVRYFDGTDAEFRAIRATQRAIADGQAKADRAPFEPSKTPLDWRDKLQSELRDKLGVERYDAWQRAQRVEHTMLVELQRRFAVPAETIAAVVEMQRQLTEKGLVIARDKIAPYEERRASIFALAGEARARTREILGEDLGDAYSIASGAGWINSYDRGFVPHYGPLGQRYLAGTGIMQAPQNQNSNYPSSSLQRP